MIETIYLIRHAFRANWVVDPTTGEYTASIKSPTGIPTDPPLAAHGVKQANELAEALWKLDPPVDVVYSSPFYRCLQTLKPATDRWFAEGKAGGKIRIERAIGEFYGLADFSHPTPPSLEILSPLFPNLDQDYTSLLVPHPKGELITELHERVKSSLHAIISALDREPGQPKTVLICSHAATMIAAGRALTGNAPHDLNQDDFQCFTASLSRFERKKGAKEGDVLGQFDCTVNSDTSYLSGGAERGWKFNGEESFISFPEPAVEDRGSPKL
ncbi:phosphoglycerate mutase family protein [Corynespora cassiicola Philippines]|uniref:Phosphoglycerate mutase family protein n=1 Tax=Corynespora cassiicola Philippines TaxID=1448308 RepID=A0A2T2NA64_CORCC|nr:phosphoglycerate mutase family protein [Corynespora cassiicola Philippines]